MADRAADIRPLEFGDLAAALAKGCKPRDRFRIGAEHEKFGFHEGTLRRPAYEGEGGIEALLKGLMRFGWTGVYEDNRHGRMLIGLERGGANVSLEPGGQFELSGAPLADIHAIAAETATHLDEVKAVAAPMGLGFVGMGHDPLWARADIPVMPKGRYDIMRSYMPKVGGLGLDMMLRTSTVQANLDFESEADMVLKFRVSLALQPIATALFAASPFVEGRPTGWVSSRARVWTDTDPDRTGLLDFVFQDGFGFETYARYALDVPMYFVKREGRYVDLSGRSFRTFMERGLDDLPGERPTVADWDDHLTTVFPEVRLKSYLEMRGADSAPLDRLNALPAFWAGLLYDDATLHAAWELCRPWVREQRDSLRVDSARIGLRAEVGGRILRDVAVHVVALARAGLVARGLGEEVYLAPLEEIADSGMTPADRMLERYHGAWGGDVRKLYGDLAY